MSHMSAITIALGGAVAASTAGQLAYLAPEQILPLVMRRFAEAPSPRRTVRRRVPLRVSRLEMRLRETKHEKPSGRARATPRTRSPRSP